MPCALSTPHHTTQHTTPHNTTHRTTQHNTPHHTTQHNTHTVDAALVPSQSLPIWSVALPQVATTETNGRENSGVRLVSGKDKILFADVVKSFLGCKKLLDVRTLNFPHPIQLMNLIVTSQLCTKLYWVWSWELYLQYVYFHLIFFSSSHFFSSYLFFFFVSLISTKVLLIINYRHCFWLNSSFYYYYFLTKFNNYHYYYFISEILIKEIYISRTKICPWKVDIALPRILFKSFRNGNS